MDPVSVLAAKVAAHTRGGFTAVCISDTHGGTLHGTVLLRCDTAEERYEGGAAHQLNHAQVAQIIPVRALADGRRQARRPVGVMGG